MAETLERIQVAAFEARQAFEDKSIPDDLLRDLYAPYLPEARDIDVYVRTAKQWFPYGSCRLATLYLHHVLQLGKVYEGSYLIKSHTYLDIGSVATNHIADISADQFGGPKVYVGPLHLPWRLAQEPN